MPENISTSPESAISRETPITEQKTSSTLLTFSRNKKPQFTRRAFLKGLAAATGVALTGCAETPKKQKRLNRMGIVNYPWNIPETVESAKKFARPLQWPEIAPVFAAYGYKTTLSPAKLGDVYNGLDVYTQEFTGEKTDDNDPNAIEKNFAYLEGGWQKKDGHEPKIDTIKVGESNVGFRVVFSRQMIQQSDIKFVYISAMSSEAGHMFCVPIEYFNDNNDVEVIAFSANGGKAYEINQWLQKTPAPNDPKHTLHEVDNVYNPCFGFLRYIRIVLGSVPISYNTDGKAQLTLPRAGDREIEMYFSV